MNGRTLLITASTIATIITASLIALIFYIEGGKSNDVVDNNDTPVDKVVEDSKTIICSKTESEFDSMTNSDIEMTEKVILDNSDKMSEMVLELKYKFQTTEDYASMKTSIENAVEFEIPGVTTSNSFDDVNLVITSTTKSTVLQSESTDGSLSISVNHPSDAGREYFVGAGYNCN